MRILLVEDEAGMAKIVKDSLEYKGYIVDHCLNGMDGLESFLSQGPDIIVLDVMMLEMDGFDLAKKIRERDTKTPIIFLTARTQTTDVLKGFEIGANDYVKKPFSMEELIVRINFQLKQREKSVDKKYRIGNYAFDGKNQRLMINDKIRILSYRESELLRKLYEHRHEILTRKDLIDDLWDYDNFFTGRSLDVFISRIRTYLKEDPQVSIVNIRKAGYKLVINQTAHSITKLD